MSKNTIQQKNQKKYQHDLMKLQKNYFESSVANVKEANSAMKSAQNWLLLLGTAEVAFLGTLFVGHNDSILIKILLAILIASFIFFMFGSFAQYKHLLRSARYYERLYLKVFDYILCNNHVVDDIPENLKDSDGGIKTNRIANCLIATAIFLETVSTIGIIVVIFMI